MLVTNAATGAGSAGRAFVSGSSATDAVANTGAIAVAEGEGTVTGGDAEPQLAERTKLNASRTRRIIARLYVEAWGESSAWLAKPRPYHLRGAKLLTQLASCNEEPGSNTTQCGSCSRLVEIAERPSTPRLRPARQSRLQPQLKHLPASRPSLPLKSSWPSMSCSRITTTQVSSARVPGLVRPLGCWGCRCRGLRLSMKRR